MLVELVIILIVIAFILTYMTYVEESTVFGMLGFLMWMVLFAQTLYIEDIAGNTYIEYGLSALCLAFIFVQIVLVIVYFLEWNSARQMP